MPHAMFPHGRCRVCLPPPSPIRSLLEKSSLEERLHVPTVKKKKPARMLLGLDHYASQVREVQARGEGGCLVTVVPPASGPGQDPGHHHRQRIV